MNRRLSLRLSGIKLNQVKFQPRSLTYMFLIGFFVIGAFYVFTVNRVSNKGTQLNNLYESNKEMEAENARLATEAARLASLRVIDQGASGEVETGTEESKPAQSPVSSAPEGSEVEAQSITLELKPPTPRLVMTEKQTYLPSYGGVVAQR